MTSPRSATRTDCSTLLRSLEALDRSHPTDRKRLVGPDVNFGRELLVALARRTGGWVGWESTTLGGIARALAWVPLAEQGIRVAGDVTINALVNQALERTIAAGLVQGTFAALAPGLGFRRALLDTLLELRTAGVSADDVRKGATPGSPAADLPAVITEYERLLSEHALADVPMVFGTAIAAFDREAPFVLDGVIALAPTRQPRGLPGMLHALLVARGAITLDADDAADGVLHDSVDASFFAAATPSDELREICRRVVAEGVRWDDVEIVATDPDVYGIALDALGQRIGVGATMLQGIPLARTRMGRALDRWLGWLDDGLSADALRQALEAGELALLEGELPSTALSRELRMLRLGWGRARYEAAIRDLGGGVMVARMKRREDESDDEFVERRASRARTCAALERLLVALLAVTPAVPERGSAVPVRSTCASLASATLGWLALCPAHGLAEAATVANLRERLSELAAVDDPETSWSSALATLRESLADLRAWPLVTSERKPWSAAGGMPHLTTTTHAGTTGRRRIFVVGLDADRTSGMGRQDPLLPDAARRVIAPRCLVTSTERRDETSRMLVRALAALRGRVTMSYATRASLDGREAGPSPLMLQAWRSASGDPVASYETLREALRPSASAVPSRDDHGELLGVLSIDARDVWLDAMSDGSLLLDGTTSVRAAFPVLAAGLDAHDIANGDVLTAWHGLVPEAGKVLDPAAQRAREISPSSLESLASCPLKWFYRYGLSLYPVQDPEYDEDVWLGPLNRGALLHEVFEAFTREYHDRQSEIADDAASRRMKSIVAAAIATWRDSEPPPSESVFDIERSEIDQAASAFLQMERDRLAAGDRGRWIAFELAFGRGAAAGPFTLPDGEVLLTNGRADRVDEMPDGTLRVIDYKTGKATNFARGSRIAPFNGGRQLQPAIYSAAVEALMKQPVSTFEYRFPTARGGNEIVAYSADELHGVGDIISGLLGHVHAGEFIPTTDAGDCGYCDYQEVCRASRGKYNRTDSPRADWAAAHADGLEEYASMLARRAVGGDA
jgi:ATP-dependent helicase/nuclease subunit B